MVLFRGLTGWRAVGLAVIAWTVTNATALAEPPAKAPLDAESSEEVDFEATNRRKLADMAERLVRATPEKCRGPRVDLAQALSEKRCEVFISEPTPRSLEGALVTEVRPVELLVESGRSVPVTVELRNADAQNHFLELRRGRTGLSAALVDQQGKDLSTPPGGGVVGISAERERGGTERREYFTRIVLRPGESAFLTERISAIGYLPLRPSSGKAPPPRGKGPPSPPSDLPRPPSNLPPGEYGLTLSLPFVGVEVAPGQAKLTVVSRRPARVRIAQVGFTTTSAATAPAGVSIAALTRALETGLRPKVESCLDSARDDELIERGSIKLYMSVEPDGRTGAASNGDIEPRSLPQFFTSCVAGAAAGIALPRSTNPQRYMVELAVELEP